MSILHRLMVEQGRRPDEGSEDSTAPDPKPKEPKNPDKPKRPGTRTFTTNRKGPGRPPSASPAYTRNKRVTVPLSMPEYETVHAAAHSQGLPVSSLIRRAMFGEIKLHRPHPEHGKSEVAVERLSGVEPKIDGRTRAGKAQKARRKREKAAKDNKS